MTYCRDYHHRMELLQALLVDDHPLFREGFIAAVRLKLPQVSFTVAGTVAQARLLAVKLQPDLVLSDSHLPPELHQVSLRVGESVHVLEDLFEGVLISGTMNPALRAQAESANCIALPKPVRPLQLRAMLGQIGAR